jgi:putative membrane protein
LPGRPASGRNEVKLAAQVAAAFVAALHVYFLVLEMFLWTRPFGRRTFGLTPEFAAASRSLAANQGLYNGFLAAGLIFGFLYPEPRAGLHIEMFFLICVVAAGAYGGYSVSPKIFAVQAMPALIALVLLWFS